MQLLESGLKVKGVRAFEEKLQRYWLLRIRYSGAHRSRNQVTAGAISSTATFLLEVARKHMQAAGAINGRQYQSMLHALMSIFENEGLPGLYRGLGPSCVKLVPTAGISFMCYEACKRILVEKEEDD
ncbi:hypothetical protein SO802_012648 [Lithocarpus litseifolius]|uniref:Uncharacterized protein n=1 Tax=Lithocarpus litseifolius TaxID=425828 RepID=A0AAW2D5H7_9ROSI